MHDHVSSRTRPSATPLFAHAKRYLPASGEPQLGRVLLSTLRSGANKWPSTNWLKLIRFRGGADTFRRSSQLLNSAARGG